MSEWMDGYQWGYLHGLEEGLRRGGDERDAEWERKFGQAAQIVHAAARWPGPGHWSREATRARYEDAQRRIDQRLDEIRSQMGQRKDGQEEQWVEPPPPLGAVGRTTTEQGGNSERREADASGRGG